MPVLRSRVVPSLLRKPPQTPSQPPVMAPSTPSPSSVRRHRSPSPSPPVRRRSLRFSLSATAEKRRRISRDDKGKAVVADDEEAAAASDRDPDVEEEEVAAEIVEIATAEVDGMRIDAVVDQVESAHVTDRRERDRAVAIKAAPRFAYFKPEEAENPNEGDDGDEKDEVESGGGEEDWPGPFSTAMKLIREREERLNARCAAAEAPKLLEITWKPTRKGRIHLVPPSLLELSLKVLAANASEIESLDGIPGTVVKWISAVVCGSRKMSYGFLSMLVNGEVGDIYVPDCSWVEEEKFEEIFSRCNTEFLQTLQLDLCGRCLPDYVLSSTLARAPNSLPNLLSISLVGNYRLSDEGLMLLAHAAPMLRSINLSKCSLITSAGTIKMLEKLEGVKKLIFDDCQNVSGIMILPALKKLKELQAISVSRLQDVNNKFVSSLVSACANLEELGLAGCLKVSAMSTKIIGEVCPQLHTIDLRNIPKLNDKAIAYLASGCPSIRKLLLQRNDCSDEAIAAFLEASGNSLVELSLNNLAKVSHHTAIAISVRCSSTLQNLDLSFCRLMSDEALGLIVDSCTQLKTLKLFGCTQVTDVFLNGHSNAGVQIIGVRGSILEKMEIPGF